MARTIRTVFAERAKAEQVNQVERLIAHARGLLDRVVETLPTYTLHNASHAENVITLMDLLLGDHVERLTPLEAAMLMLSAYFHDIGLVYTEAERTRLREAPDFAEFLQSDHATALAIRRAGDEPLSRDAAERYCRWAHARRVAVHLNDEKLVPLLRWGVTDLTPYLRDVCQSHGWDTESLRDDTRFPTDFLAECDLRMCAILLRLADIMDFDRSRTPAAVYDYLGLAEATSERDIASEREWRKHYDADGFKFLPGDLGRGLIFVAAPDEPGVEHDIRQFLDVIEDEFEACRLQLRSCDDRWRDLVLPAQIRRTGIHGRGYRYGPYRFEMDRSEVLRLFTGENLYASRYVFIRELLQNAMDASRHRAAAEKHRTGRPYSVDAIQVCEWRDGDGRLWIQVSDGGQGMDEHILVEYFLRLGRSYYASDEFKMELLDYTAGNGGFLPISRFGIGVLSCFIVADRVELSSLLAGGGHAAIRLSMWGRDGFYALQVDPDQTARPMPGPTGQLPGYRTRPGTTIAVRLDPARETGDLDVAALLRAWVTAPPVPVEYEGERIGTDPAELVGRWPLEPVRVPLPPEMRARLAAEFTECRLPVPFDDTVSLRFTPIDLTAASPSPYCRGQLVAVHIDGIRREVLHIPAARVDRDDEHRTTGRLAAVRPAWTEARSVLGLDLEICEVDDGSGSLRKFHHVSFIAVASADIEELLPEDGEWLRYLRAMLGRPPWSHNGIALPGRRLLEDFPAGSVRYDGPEMYDVLLAGQLILSDLLRPDMDVSRDEVRSLPWEVRSTATLAVRRALAAAGFVAPRVSALHRLVRVSSPIPWNKEHEVATLGLLLADPLLRADDGWPAEAVVATADGRLPVHALTTAARLEHVPYFGITTGHHEAEEGFSFQEDGFYDTCVAALLASRVRLAAVRGDDGWSTVIERADPPHLPDGEMLFPPLCFVPYRGSDGFYESGLGINRDHALASWIIDHAPLLQERHPGILATLRARLTSLPSATPADIPTIVTAVNQVLDRLGMLRSGIPAPRSMRLRESELVIPDVDAEDD